MGALNTVSDLDRVLRPYENEFVAFRTISIKNSSQEYLKEEFNVNKEGIYYTIFVYAEDTPLNSTRLLKATHTVLDSEPHLVMYGTISFENSYGYLNAE